MKECVKVIDSMDISDKDKSDIHSRIDSSKRQFLNDVKSLIDEKISGNLHTYVEHTHKGLNLRVVPSDPNTAKEVKAICEYAGLNKISENKTNESIKYIWLRFTIE